MTQGYVVGVDAGEATHHGHDGDAQVQPGQVHVQHAQEAQQGQHVAGVDALHADKWGMTFGIYLLN